MHPSAPDSPPAGDNGTSVPAPSGSAWPNPNDPGACRARNSALSQHVAARDEDIVRIDLVTLTNRGTQWVKWVRQANGSMVKIPVP
jgi:hypothetical protein